LASRNITRVYRSDLFRSWATFDGTAGWKPYDDHNRRRRRAPFPFRRATGDQLWEAIDLDRQAISRAATRARTATLSPARADRRVGANPAGPEEHRRGRRRGHRRGHRWRERINSPKTGGRHDPIHTPPRRDAGRPRFVPAAALFDTAAASPLRSHKPGVAQVVALMRLFAGQMGRHWSAFPAVIWTG
jgi:hypothetical protein